jgi:hypothetical protein
MLDTPGELDTSFNAQEYEHSDNEKMILETMSQAINLAIETCEMTDIELDQGTAETLMAVSPIAVKIYDELKAQKEQQLSSGQLGATGSANPVYSTSSHLDKP